MKNTQPIRQNPTFVDLFSGCGGLSLGFINAGFDCLLALDNDPQAIAVYNQKLKGKRDKGAEQIDLSQFKTSDQVKRFLEEKGVGQGSCSVLIGGPPCQSFSVVGQNKTRSLAKQGDAIAEAWEQKHRERVNLFEVYALFLEVLAPDWFVFENVPSIRSHEVFGNIITRFGNLRDADNQSLSYVFDHKTPNYLASRFGLPQDRLRFILVGHKSELGGVQWKPPIERSQVVVSDALDDLPEILHGNQERDLPYQAEAKSEFQKLMRGSGPEGQATSKVLDHICRWHNPDDVELFNRMASGAKFADEDVQQAIREINPEHKLIKYAVDKFKDKLHKLDPNRPAWTVTAHLQRDCYKFIHHRQARTISVREAARLQTFPDWFSFAPVKMIGAFRLIGNAVPPLLAQRFAESIREAEQKVSRDIYSTDRQRQELFSLAD